MLRGSVQQENLQQQIEYTNEENGCEVVLTEQQG
jgi:hypothetical protein